jgi:uncharacterized protein (DUF1800 family)
VLDESQDKTVSAVDDLQDADRHQQSERVTDAVYLSALPHPPSVTVGAALALSAAALALASCGNGSNDGSQNNATQPAPASPPPPPPPAPVTDPEAARFLQQAQFTSTDADISAVKSQGFASWLNARFEDARGQTGWDFLVSQNFNIASSTRQEQIFFSNNISPMIWNQLFSGADQVRRRLSLALSEYMVVSVNPIDGFWPTYLMAGYWDVLMDNVFGNFRTLLEAVTLNPAMGRYLNTAGNLKEDAASGRVPDENYAREVMQLFTIGLYDLNTDGSIKLDASGNRKESYTQSDITNIAHVFTGYDLDYSKSTYQTVSYLSYKVPTQDFARGPMAFKASDHSTLAVNFLGSTIAANTEGAAALKSALDTLFNHPNVGPFFGRQMIQKLVTSNPSPAYVDRVTAAFNNNGSGVRGDLKAVWRAILTDSEARSLSTAANTGKLREPVVRVVQWGRTFKAKSKTGKWTAYAGEADYGINQEPLRAPSVFNFYRPGYVPPNTEIATAAMVAPEFQLHHEVSTVAYINILADFVGSTFGLADDIQPDYTELLSTTADAKALVDWLNLRLTANQLSSNTLSMIQASLEKTVVTAASPDKDKLNRIYGAVMLIMACPEYLIQK